MFSSASLRSALTLVVIAGVALLTSPAAQAQCQHQCPTSFQSQPESFQPVAFTSNTDFSSTSFTATNVQAQAPAAVTPNFENSAPTEASTAPAESAVNLNEAIGSLANQVNNFFQSSGEKIQVVGNFLQFFAGACSVFAVVGGWMTARRHVDTKRC